MTNTINNPQSSSSHNSKTISSSVQDGLEDTKMSIAQVLEKSQYLELFSIAKKLEEQYHDGIRFDYKFYEEMYDYFGKYSIVEAYDLLGELGHSSMDIFENFDGVVSLEIELVPIMRLIQNYKESKELEEKNEVLSNIYAELRQVFDKNNFITHDGTDESEFTIDQIHLLGSDTFLLIMLGGGSRSCHTLNNIGDFLQKIRFDSEFDEQIGGIDIEKLRENTHTMGAKGANLTAIKDIMERLSSISYETIGDFYVPSFEIIPVSVYQDWLEGKTIDKILRDYFASITEERVILRSSAVYSEDGENATGAGIYESLVFKKEDGYELFKTKIIEIYKSIDSDRAQSYREENEIKQEKMGIVIQKYLGEESYQNSKSIYTRDPGYINTQVKGVPGLMDIYLDNGLRPVVNKESLHNKLVSPLSRESIFHYQFDGSRIDSMLEITTIAYLGVFLEKYYGAGVQIEYLWEDIYDEEHNLSKKIAVVQTRFLPKNYGITQEVEFPDKEPIFSGRALGVANVELDILDNFDNNLDKEGIVIFESSFFASTSMGMSIANLPKSGVVMVLGESEENKGHIETLCAERGLLLVFNNNFKTRSETDILGAYNSRRSNITDYNGHKRLHIVMDGIQANVYAADIV